MSASGALGVIAVLGVACTARGPLPDEWGRRCGVDASDSAEENCVAPFECVLRTEYISGETEKSSYECSLACTSDVDCSAELGGSRRDPVCNQSGYCANMVLSL